MITRDFILRQISQLAQALARVLFKKQAKEYVEAQEILASELKRVFGMDLEQIHTLDLEDLLALCRSGDGTSAEMALILADLLREDASPAGRQQAVWLYETALAAGGPVPLDVHERINTLRETLKD
ncbi:MAG TPA: DUF6483 family protein [Rhodothermales bacterium]|nr:DUF6483 family protein [Rhodothermales bacterium]